MVRPILRRGFSVTWYSGWSIPGLQHVLMPQPVPVPKKMQKTTPRLNFIMHIPLTWLLSLAVLVCSNAPLTYADPYSKLWGREGEAWDPNGLLRDFTEVGYQLGEEPIPDWPLWKNITDFGAIPNDKLSDLDALKQALAECPPEHAVGIPNGTFIIDDGFDVSANNIVIRGESRDGAILFFPKHMKEIDPGYRNNFESFIRFTGGENRGLENLSLILRDEQKATGYVPPPPEVKNQRARHWYYSGENLVSFGGGEKNSWMRHVYLKNGNHVIRIDGQGTGQITLQDLVLDNFINRTMPEDPTDGHMGIKVGTGAQRVLVHNVLLTGVYHHDITPMGARFCVFSRIRGPNIELDHHAMGNEGNLFTEIDIGYGNRGYGEAHNNMDETYWGIKGFREGRITSPKERNIFVGLNSEEPNDFGEKHWVETIDPDALQPKNLYLAQLEFLGKRLPEARELALPAPVPGAPLRLLPVDDARLDAREADRNFGHHGNMVIKSSGKASLRAGLMKFDLSEIEADSLAHIALRLYAKRAPGGDDFPLRIEYIEDDSWEEWAVTFDNQPETSVTVTEADLSGSGWHDMDLTAFVKERLALGDRILSFKFIAREKSGNLGLTTKEGGNEPQLIIHFDESTVAPPEAPTGLGVQRKQQSLSLRWQENAEEDLHSYNVYRKSGEGAYDIEAMGLIHPEYEDFVIEPGKTYTYVVRAVDTAGTESAPSDESVATF
jgi:hypothetical protein